jgi:hypothetical protein
VESHHSKSVNTTVFHRTNSDQSTCLPRRAGIHWCTLPPPPHTELQLNQSVQAVERCGRLI